MTYREYTEARQEEFNKLPIFFAFSIEQFNKALEERGIKPEEAGKHIYRFGTTGGYYLKKDSEIIKKFFSKDHDAELRKMMESDLAFARDAITYEMFNHEYAINWEGDWDVCGCFGKVKYVEGKPGEAYMRDLGFSEAVIKVYHEAASYVLKNTEC